MNRLGLSLAVTVAGLAGRAFAVVINVPGDHSIIQDAIDAAVDGDEIVVGPGTYNETNINFLGKAITLRSSDGPEVTIIHGAPPYAVLVCSGGEGRDTVIDGFTITNGQIGMLFVFSSPTVMNCIITSNSGNSIAGGLWINGSPLIQDCTITGNSATTTAGGVFVEIGAPELIGCLISGNSAPFGGGVVTALGTSPLLTGCTLTGNVASGGSGGGVWAGSNQTALVQCLITGNSATDQGGGAFGGSLTDCVIRFNVAASGEGTGTSGGVLTGSTVCSNWPSAGVPAWGPFVDGGGNVIVDVCPDTVGACCIAGSCVVTTETACIASGGTFAGDGSSCVEAACPEPCPTDTNDDGVTNVLDLIQVLLAFGTACP